MKLSKLNTINELYFSQEISKKDKVIKFYKEKKIISEELVSIIHSINKKRPAIGGMLFSVKDQLDNGELDKINLSDIPATDHALNVSRKVNDTGLLKYEMIKGLKWPVKNLEWSYISDEYGVCWWKKGKRDHAGIDIVSKFNVKVFPVANGQVIDVGYDNIYGNYIIIDHGDFKTFYTHLQTVYVSKYQYVLTNSWVGIIGNTGKGSNGAHLHLEVWKGGQTINPLTNSCQKKPVSLKRYNIRFKRG
jgi:murein DD-endopeptidase MepM/ murein hydrolase activator NlpD